MKLCDCQIQRIPKLVIQKSVVTSELEVTIWSGMFQKSFLILIFSFKPPNGIPLVQNCLKILPVIMESYIGAEHAVLFVVSQIAIPHFHSEKIQDQVSQNMTPKNEYFGMVRITKVVVTTDADMSQGFGTKSLTDGTTAM